MRFLTSASRGQTLAESMLFIPIVLLLLFGTIYISQFAVTSERSQTAVRYGGNTSFSSASSQIFSVARVYDIIGGGSPLSCPTPPAGIITGASPLPGPASAPYWQPASVTTSCSMFTQPRANGGFLAASREVATATVNVPSYISSIGHSVSAGASEAYVHPADPGVIMTCSTVVSTQLNSSLRPAAASPLPSVTPMSASSYTALTYSCPTPGP